MFAFLVIGHKLPDGVALCTIGRGFGLSLGGHPGLAGRFCGGIAQAGAIGGHKHGVIGRLLGGFLGIGFLAGRRRGRRAHAERLDNTHRAGSLSRVRSLAGIGLD